jgi:hypothetical protein
MPKERNVVTEASNAVSAQIIDALIKKFKIDFSSFKKKDIEKALYPVLQPIVGTLNQIRYDSQMAIADDWDRSDSGFEAQIENIEEVCPELNEEYDYPNGRDEIDED